MKRFTALLVAALALWGGAFTHAAYNTATIKVNEPVANQPGVYRLVVSFSGNAGEPTVERETTIAGSTTALSLRQWAITQATDLNATRAVATAAQLQPGQTVNLSAIAPPAQTALQVWQQKVLRLGRVRAIGLTNATAVAEIQALEKDVNDTYLSGFVAAF